MLNCTPLLFSRLLGTGLNQDPAYRILIQAMLMRGKKDDDQGYRKFEDDVWKHMPIRIAKTRLVSEREKPFWQRVGKRVYVARGGSGHLARLAMARQPGYYYHRKIVKKVSNSKQLFFYQNLLLLSSMQNSIETSTVCLYGFNGKGRLAFLQQGGNSNPTHSSKTLNAAIH